MADTGESRFDQLKRVAKKVMQQRPVRALQRFTNQRGPVLAAGMTYLGLFALFAALWVAVSISGLVLNANDERRAAFFSALNEFVPGLIAIDGAAGVVKADDVLQSTTLTVTGAIALIGLMVTAVNWLGAARGAIRGVFGIPKPAMNFLLLKARDLGIAIGLGAFVVLSAALSIASTQLLRTLLDLVGYDGSSGWQVALARTIGLVVMAAIDFTLMLVFYRVLSGVHVKLRMLASAALIAAVGLGALKLAGNLLLGGATNNPLIASFAVLLGLLIWLNLACRVILLGAAWAAETLEDHDIAPDERLAAQAEAEELERQAEIERRARELVPGWLRWSVRSKD